MVNLKFLKNIIVKFQYNLVNMKYLENFNEYAEYFNNIDFIMFTPDSIVMNEFANVVKKYNIKILNYKCININEYEAEKIYSNELCTGKIDSWWIKKKIFSMGLTCVALITLDIKKHNMLASDIILALKGDSDSLISSHNSIRGQYRVANKTYGFMHSSDSPKQALFESNTLFSINEIKNSFHKLKIGENVNESFFNDFILNFNYKYDLYNYYELLFDLKNKVLDIFIKKNHISEMQIDIYDKIKLLYSNAKKVCHEKNSFKEERIQIQKYIFKENELLTDFFKLSQTDYTEDLSYWLILTLSNQKKYNKVDFDKIKIVLKILKIHMNEWELLLLQSSMHFYKII